jgi:hypothetical protein
MDALSVMFEIDIDENYRVKDKADMCQARFHHSAVYDASNDFIFVIGGMVGNPEGN